MQTLTFCEPTRNLNKISRRHKDGHCLVNGSTEQYTGHAKAPVRRFPKYACFPLGLGLGGSFVGIVLHQLLQWPNQSRARGFPQKMSPIERGIRWDDSALGIDWPKTPTEISDNDRNWPDFVDQV